MKLRFLIVDIRDYHEEDETCSDSETEDVQYNIRLFGRTAPDDPEHPDKSVCATLTGFTPFFYLRKPRNWNSNDVNALRSFMTKRVGKGFVKIVERQKKDFDGFRLDQTESFLQLIFSSAASMRKGANVLRHPVSIGSRQSHLKQYESNVDPILKMLHIQGVKGASWVTVDGKLLVKTPQENDTDDSGDEEEKVSYCDLEIVAKWNGLLPDTERNEQGHYCKLRVLSYDIETMSTDPRGGFPQAFRQGDAVIQVGMTFNYYQEKECYHRTLIAYPDCDPSLLPDMEVILAETEEELLAKFIAVLRRHDPDVITGYNIFGFDAKYMWTRSNRFGSVFAHSFSRWGRMRRSCKYLEKKLSSSALGDNTLCYLDADGRVQIDLFKVVQRDYSLETYKLDFVASYFNQNAVQNLTGSTFRTVSTSGLEVGGYFLFKTKDPDSGVEDYSEEKFRVVSIGEGNLVTFEGPAEQVPNPVHSVKWCMAKDDLPAQELFRYQGIDAAHRSVIGKYCIKDCVLVNFLLEKLDVITMSMAMANVCWIPLSYLFIRGQGVKIASLINEKCRRENYVIPVVRKEDFIDRKASALVLASPSVACTMDECTWETRTGERCTGKKGKRYEAGRTVVCDKCHRVQYRSKFDGARVIEPQARVHWEPVAVLDYASLYPRSIISRNMSWETQVQDAGSSQPCPEGYRYHRVTYKDDGVPTECVFAQKLDGTLGIIPSILMNLLDERTATKKKMKKETDAFKKRILDGHQLALKVTANSLYGQMGALTSPVYRRDIAACTTAVGQEMLEIAQRFVEDRFKACVMEIASAPDRETAVRILHEKHGIVSETMVDEILEFARDHEMDPQVVYGDTDSVFIRFNVTGRGSEGESETRKRELAIMLGKWAAEFIRPTLDFPHDLEYEKTFYPWMILCKKKYAGPKYEDDPLKSSMTHMGIVLKRRDNAKIVKKICGGILNLMMTQKEIEPIVRYAKETLNDIIEGKYDHTYFVTTKRLRADYKNPDQIAHAYLAKRMRERDPGSAPQVNDRISYVQVYRKEQDSKKKKILQGDKIEEVGYVLANKLEIDYLYYITNQIMIPACQFLDLIVPGSVKKIFQPVIDKIEFKRVGRTNILEKFFTSEKKGPFSVAMV